MIAHTMLFLEQLLILFLELLQLPLHPCKLILPVMNDEGDLRTGKQTYEGKKAYKKHEGS